MDTRDVMNAVLAARECSTVDADKPAVRCLVCPVAQFNACMRLQGIDPDKSAARILRAIEWELAQFRQPLEPDRGESDG